MTVSWPNCCGDTLLGRFWVYEKGRHIDHIVVVISSSSAKNKINIWLIELQLTSSMRKSSFLQVTPYKLLECWCCRWQPWACMCSLPLLLFSSFLGVWGHFAKTWVSLQTTPYKSDSVKYFDTLLLLTCEEVLHAPTVRIWAQNPAILPTNNLLIQ